MRQIEAHHTEALEDGRIVQHRAVLPRIASRRVQAQQRNATTGLLYVDAVLLTEEVEQQIAADDRLECRTAHAALLRTEASTSLK